MQSLLTIPYISTPPSELGLSSLRQTPHTKKIQHRRTSSSMHHAENIISQNQIHLPFILPYSTKCLTNQKEMHHSSRKQCTNSSSKNRHNSHTLQTSISSHAAIHDPHLQLYASRQGSSSDTYCLTVLVPGIVGWAFAVAWM